MLNRAVDDLIAALKALARNPRLTAVMVLTLALGPGANTVIFSIVQSVLFVDAGFGRSSGRVVSLHALHPGAFLLLFSPARGYPSGGPSRLIPSSP